MNYQGNGRSWLMKGVFAVLILAILASHQAYAQSTHVLLKPMSYPAEICEGQSFDVTFGVETTKTIGEMQAWLSFDPNLLNADSAVSLVQGAQIFPQFGTLGSVVFRAIRACTACPPAIDVPTGTTELFTVSFTAKQSGSVNLSFSSSDTWSKNIIKMDDLVYLPDSLTQTNQGLELTVDSCSCRLSVSPTVHEVSNEADIVSFEVTTNGCTTNWTAESNTSWLAIASGDFGTGNGTITVSYETNSGDARVGTVTVTAPDAENSPQTIEVKQTMKAIDNGVVLDMDIEGTNPDIEIESEISVCQEDEIWIAVVALNVTDLDTYQVEVSFDTDKLEFLEGAEENPMGGINNLLKKNGGTTTGFLAVEDVPGTVNISDTLTGADCDEAPEGSGVLALLKFKVLSAGTDAELTLGNTFFVDCTGDNQGITDLRNGTFTVPAPIPGDFNKDGIVNFIDLGLLANNWLLTDSDSEWNPKSDLNADGIVNYLDLSILGDHWLEEGCS